MVKCNWLNQHSPKLKKTAPKFSFEMEYQYVPEYSKDIKGSLFIIIELETPLLVHEGQTVIGSKLDTDIEANVCRIAFYGKILVGIEDDKSRKLKTNKDIEMEGEEGSY